MATAFSIESCANCLLDDLEVSKSLSCELERLPTLSKFETVAHLVGKGGAFDRGCREVQIVRELLNARNDFVHPKVSIIKAEICELEDQGEYFAIPMEFLPGKRGAVELPRAALFWCSVNAARALQSATGFFKLLLVDCLQFDTDKIRNLFSPRAEAKIGDAEVVLESYFKEYEEELQRVANDGIDLSFLGIRAIESLT